MIMPGRNFNAGEYRFGFQGQEKDDEVKGVGNSISFKYRIHDPRLGRFLSIDPLAGKYPFYSPYSFSGNRVIDMIELEGAEPENPKYQWTITDYEEHPHGDMMKVNNKWWVFTSVDDNCNDLHQFFDPNTQTWKDFEPVKPKPLYDDVLKVVITSIGMAGATVGSIALIETGIMGFLVKEAIEAVAEELSGIPFVPLNPDPTDILDPYLNKEIKEQIIAKEIKEETVNKSKRLVELPTGEIPESKLMESAEKWLREGYSDLGNGRYVSEDGLRQFRLGKHETKNPDNYHAHFEAYNKPASEGGEVIEKSVVKVKDD